MASVAREAAREFIRTIREDNGGISPEDAAATRPSVLRALQKTRQKLGAATKTLATNLYSKDTRFVYELIQNSEDNQYTRAESQSQHAFLSFSIYPDRIVLDSNEDGFREKHVQAICSTGESTKTDAAQGYIGEKGIGFKSVFKVAKKVHVQSEPFSFAFHHTKDSTDDGLGMVTPQDEGYDCLPEGINTRITLTLLDPSTFEQRVKDLLALPDTLLLFLTKLRKLSIIIHRPNECTEEINYTHNLPEGGRVETITKKTTGDPTVTTPDIQRFYVVRRDITNLPPDPARQQTTKATVVLAFPVDAQDNPIIKQQHVFAFLPLRPAGFTFLIQSDFITQASREDVFHNLRNQSLLSGVADTFRDAVLRFCDHPTLQYEWMRYLPSESIVDEFWTTLRPQIISRLQNTRCLRSWSEHGLHMPAQLQYVQLACRDQFSEPLFPDLFQAGYLSKKYTYRNFQHLQILGTTLLYGETLFRRIKSDLERADSIMKAATTDDDWHTRVAQLFLTFNFTDRGCTGYRLKSLELIPLQGGSWVSAITASVFFPKTGDTEIPTDLDLNLVDHSTISNTARKSLFTKLGVNTTTSNHIINLINQKYSKNITAMTIGNHISHICYLYSNLPKDVSVLEGRIFFINQDCALVYCRASLKLKPLYFEEPEEEYGPKKLFQQSGLAPGLKVDFLHKDYLKAMSHEARSHGKSWKEWLQCFGGVQSHPQLHKQANFQLSDEFDYIIHYRSDKLVGLLRHYCHIYRPQLDSSSQVDIQKIKDCLVPCHGNQRLALESTFLPFPPLTALIETLKIEKFPFLKVPEEFSYERRTEWEFLERFGVGGISGNDDLGFYIQALRSVANENRDHCSPDSLEALHKIYKGIERNCSTQAETLSTRELFASGNLIYIPLRSMWVNSGACVWTGPEWIQTKIRLNGVWNFADFQHLFNVILRISDATWSHYVDDLKMLKRLNQGTTEKVIVIYQLLLREFAHDGNPQLIRSNFQETDLVFVPPQNTWHALSSCIWADDQARIPGKAAIKTPYTSLEDFFCKILGVQKPNLQMHVQALQALARNRPDQSAMEIRRMIKLISSLNPTTNTVTSLAKSNIFEVKLVSGTNAFTTAAADFAISDRAEYGDAFASKIRILDYSVQEVRQCSSFLLAMGLKDRHLSEIVEEKTRVDNGVISNSLTTRFRQKAYALFRCAFHYSSPKTRDEDKSLYNELLNASVYRSDGILKSMDVIQYGERVTVDGSRANFHLDEDSDELRLYVPNDEDSREECYYEQLPGRLMRYLAITDQIAELLLTRIISCKSLVAVDKILKNAGIVEVDGVERSSDSNPTADQYAHDESSARPSTPRSTGSRGSQFGNSPSYFAFGTPSSDTTPTRESLPGSSSVLSATPGSLTTLTRPGSAVDTSFTLRISSPSPSAGPSISPIPEFSTLAVNTLQERGYVALLDRLIANVGRLSIPAKGSNSEGNLQAGASNLSSIFLTRSAERDRKVGAAGELLVLELLMGLGLPGFTLSNWESTIRTEVCVHDKYRNLKPKLKREIADIIYTDTERTLTKIFIEKGYLDPEVWQSQRPTYLLEVKTTTKDCGEKFYMSGSQYNRMERSSLNPLTVSPDIYVVLRVFNLEGRTGLRVYLDPASCRNDGELEFGVETWTVAPLGV